ncbi:MULTISPECIES: gamma-glutamyltransferase family protein [Pantoea]|uniref:gamma-glutamyltransferase family protein n=1 Tax=Pantoea TaxID=53335 RepID=UPI000F0775FF|nr:MULTISPECIES: gamma-glutamyltransferase family protein [Pantoea]KAF6631031.1 gamma-glutamyltransferase family protein [Pantoea sp. EKM10T]RNA75195.1 gamma-glutamyltransferase family protein [[Curtobacterium] plantarum]UVV72754.1 gamma-glutamyltransferase family protein [Pantoea agglomerans]
MRETDFNVGYPSHRVPMMGRNAVATSQPLAAQAGLRMLQQGGNAVDAAIATAIALTVLEPTGNGIGSDAFAIVWDGSELHGLNASGRSPAAWHPERFADFSAMPETGWESVTVPGAVSAWVTLAQRFGTLPLTTLAQPAIDYARDGFPVSPLIGQLWQRGYDKLRDQPGFSDCFAPQGRPPRAGELFRNPAQARTLQEIAETQGESFYRGALAQKMTAFAREHGAALTLEDLKNHRADWVTLLSRPFAGGSVQELPPNGQGIATLIALGILEEWEINHYAPDSPQWLHLSIEAMKLALVDLDRYVTDEDHLEFPAEHLLSNDYIRQRAALIDPAKAGDFRFGSPQQSGTVYVAAGDASGMMVSFIQSNYMGFGSGVVVPDTGISLQNRGAGFSLDPDHPNVVAGGKRPFHTIIPAFARDQQGQPLMAFGVMGGPMQAQGHLQLALRIMLHQQNPQAAIDAPRWRVVQGREVVFESTLDRNTLSTLRRMGHNVVLEDPLSNYNFGGAQAIVRDPQGFYIAASESRKDGQAVVF